jgi:hypothetical protein
MKKIVTLVAAALILVGKSQAQFFEETNFVGALSSDASKDWTTGWTNFNPQSTSYPAANETTTLNGSASGKLEITTTITLDATKVYLLKGMIVIKDGGKLVIPAGTIIRAEADLNATPKNYATIVVERGGKIEINGTNTKPVVITSNKAAGSRNRGDWGGIVISGKAKNNQSADNQIEGFNNVSFDATMAKGGGTDDADNSGSITYVRLEYGGLAFEANKEINGITFNSVGSGTKVEGIQCSYTGDDGFEWFGGTVNAKKLVAFRITDDDFDTDFGFRGAVQFGIGVKDTSQYDLTYAAPSGASTSEGFESDNDAAGSGKTPYTAAVFSNMTMVGPVKIGSTYADLPTVQKNAFRRGARIRRNTRISIVNSVFMGYRNFLMIDGDSTMTAAGIADSTFPATMAFQNNVIVNSAAAFSPASSTANGLVEKAGTPSLNRLDGWVKAASNKNNINSVAYTAGTVLVDPQNATSPVFRPVTASPANAGASFTHPRVASFGTFNSVNTLENIGTYVIYPNPSAGSLFAELELTAPEKVNVFITNLNGTVVVDAGSHSLNAGFNSIACSTESLNNGLYLIVIAGENGKLTQKVLVQK